MRKSALALGLLVALLAVAGGARAHVLDTALVFQTEGAVALTPAPPAPPISNTGTFTVTWSGVQVAGIYEGSPVAATYTCGAATGTREGNLAHDNFVAFPFGCTLGGGVGPPTLTASFTGTRIGTAFAVGIQVAPTAYVEDHVGLCEGTLLDPLTFRFVAFCQVT